MNFFLQGLFGYIFDCWLGYVQIYAFACPQYERCAGYVGTYRCGYNYFFNN